MADPSKRLPGNAAGPFFVEESCIDCDACRQIAPASFREEGEFSVVHRQPSTDDETLLALMALVACPTGSIGALGAGKENAVARGIDAFPSAVVENIHFCGFTSKDSFGAWSYLIARPAEAGGNVLVDSPRFAAPLVRKIAAMGGVQTMFLTHSDDIADHAAFAREFGCQRVMHAADGAERIGVERVIGESGDRPGGMVGGDQAGRASLGAPGSSGGDSRAVNPVRLDDELLAIPTPGHTRGHMVLLYRNRFLFTGDHLSWSPDRNTLTAFAGACWYSWPEQTRSMERLRAHPFEWVLPGHGRIHHASAAAMRGHLDGCIEWMKTVRSRGSR